MKIFLIIALSIGLFSGISYHLGEIGITEAVVSPILYAAAWTGMIYLVEGQG